MLLCGVQRVIAQTICSLGIWGRLSGLGGPQAHACSTSPVYPSSPPGLWNNKGCQIDPQPAASVDQTKQAMLLPWLQSLLGLASSVFRGVLETGADTFKVGMDLTMKHTCKGHATPLKTHFKNQTSSSWPQLL